MAPFWNIGTLVKVAHFKFTGESPFSRMLACHGECPRVSSSIHGLVTLPKRSGINVFSRLVLRKCLIIVSTLVEPARSRIRRHLLRIATTNSPLVDWDWFGDQGLLFLMVYRSKNAHMAMAMLEQLPSGADVRLWALDGAAQELVAATVGAGPGSRFSNLNKLYCSRPVHPGAWVVISDDDAIFAKGTLSSTIRFMVSAGFSLAQPSHSVLGWWTSLFNIGRPLLKARDTNYVEQGPVLIADSSFSKSMFPLPDEGDMGWGVEAEWYPLKSDAFRFGVIDCCRIVHWGRSAVSYKAKPQMLRMQERLSKSGVENIWQLQTVNARWWIWQKSPKWMA